MVKDWHGHKHSVLSSGLTQTAVHSSRSHSEPCRGAMCLWVLVVMQSRCSRVACRTLTKFLLVLGLCIYPYQSNATFLLRITESQRLEKTSGDHQVVFSPGWTDPGYSAFPHMGDVSAIFVTICWTLSSSSLFLLNWGAQNQAQYSRCGLTRAEKRRRITPLNLPATLFLKCSRIPLAFLATRAHCWLTANLLSTRTCRSLPAELSTSSNSFS